MEMKDLERIIDERSKAMVDNAKAELTKELGAGATQAQIDEAVQKAVSEITAKADKDKAENVKYLEAFKEAVTHDEKSFVMADIPGLIEGATGFKRRYSCTGKERLPLLKRTPQGS